MYSNEHYIKYPVMKPWVGGLYSSGATKKLLVIGESHYLPPKSTKSSDVDFWYSSSELGLTPKEVSWINTSGIIRDNKSDNFPNKAHGIFRNIGKILNEGFLSYDNSADALNHVAYLNYFQRPAETTGDSINVHKQDLEVSQKVIDDVINALKPEIVVFTSSKAGDHGQQVVEKHGVLCVAAPHPTCQWWNREAKKYGGYGRDVIPKFLKQHQWHT